MKQNISYKQKERKREKKKKKKLLGVAMKEVLKKSLSWNSTRKSYVWATVTLNDIWGVAFSVGIS